MLLFCLALKLGCAHFDPISDYRVATTTVKWRKIPITVKTPQCAQFELWSFFAIRQTSRPGIRVNRYRATIHNNSTVVHATGEALRLKALFAPGVADGTMSLELFTAECRSMGETGFLRWHSIGKQA